MNEDLVAGLITFAVLYLILAPPRYDPAIILKEWLNNKW